MRYLDFCCSRGWQPNQPSEKGGPERPSLPSRAHGNRHHWTVSPTRTGMVSALLTAVSLLSQWLKQLRRRDRMFWNQPESWGPHVILLTIFLEIPCWILCTMQPLLNSIMNKILANTLQKKRRVPETPQKENSGTKQARRERQKQINASSLLLFDWHVLNHLWRAPPLSNNMEIGNMLLSVMIMSELQSMFEGERGMDVGGDTAIKVCVDFSRWPPWASCSVVASDASQRAKCLLSLSKWSSCHPVFNKNAVCTRPCAECPGLCRIHSSLRWDKMLHEHLLCAGCRASGKSSEESREWHRCTNK